MAESKQWYAIRTQNNREKSVLEKLNLELSRSGLTDIMGRHIIPTEKVYSVKNGKRIAKEKKNDNTPITRRLYSICTTAKLGFQTALTQKR